MWCISAPEHFSNGFDDLLSNELTSPELTVEDSGRLLVITLSNEASTDARLDVYMSNSLGHHLPNRIFTGQLPVSEWEPRSVCNCNIQKFTLGRYVPEEIKKS